jgi:hypothetical protein
MKPKDYSDHIPEDFVIYVSEAGYEKLLNANNEPAKPLTPAMLKAIHDYKKNIVESTKETI